MTGSRELPLRVVTAGLFALALSALLSAASFNVNPIRIDLLSQKPTAIVTIENLADEPITIQAGVVKWDERAEGYIGEPSDDILLHPPIFTLRPHGKQIMRMGLRQKNNQLVELAYRLVLEEVPGTSEPGTGLRTILRISIPVFARAAGPYQRQLVWQARRTGEDRLTVSATNVGTAHIQVQTLQLKSANADLVREDLPTTYILPGRSREWTVRNAAMARADRVIVLGTSDAGKIDEILVPIAH